MSNDDDSQLHNSISGGIQFGPVVQGYDIHATFHLPATVPQALDQLPAPAADFSGRETDLKMLTGLLDPSEDNGPVLISAVAGLPGVGKTALAVQAGHAALQRGWFQGGVLFVDLHGYDHWPVEPERALDALLRALGVSAEHIPPGLDARAALYRSLLAEQTEAVLVVLDNASAEVQVEPLLPGGGPHRVVVTSRHTLAGLGARLVEAQVLDQDASARLLQAALRVARPGDDRIERNPTAVTQLATLCGGLPLALAISAAVLKADPSLGPGELAEELAEEHERLDRLSYNDGRTSGGLSVKAAFDLSFRKLAPDHARLFRLLPVNPGPDISTASAAALVAAPHRAVRRILGELARAHLMEPSPGVSGRWKMHDLIRLYAAQLPESPAEPDGRDQARDRLLRHYTTKTRAAVSHLSKTLAVRGAETFATLDEALSWLDAERSNLVPAAGVTVQLMMYPLAFQLSSVLVDYLAWKRYIVDWIEVATISLSAARSMNSRDQEGMGLDLLGLAFQGARRFDEAVAAHKNAAAIFQEIGDRYREGRASHNLGSALEDLRRFQEAIEAYERDLEICRQYKDLVGEAVTLNSLSGCLREESRLDEAVASSQRAIAIHRATKDLRRTGMALNTLAAALKRKGQITEGIAAGKEAVTLLRQARDPYMQGMALITLSSMFSEAGLADDAILAASEAVAIFQSLGDPYAEAQAANNLGSGLLAHQRYEEAIALYNRNAELYREMGDLRAEGGSLFNIGVAFWQAQDFGESIDAYLEAAECYEEANDLHSQGRALLDLASVLWEADYFNEMLAVSRKCADLFHETGDQRREGMALNAQGLAMLNTRNLKEAVTVFLLASLLFQAVGDEDNEVKSRINMTLVQDRLRDLRPLCSTGAVVRRGQRCAVSCDGQTGKVVLTQAADDQSVRATDGRDWTQYVITGPSGESGPLRKRRAALTIVTTLRAARVPLRCPAVAVPSSRHERCRRAVAWCSISAVIYAATRLSACVVEVRGSG